MGRVLWRTQSWKRNTPHLKLIAVCVLPHLTYRFILPTESKGKSTQLTSSVHGKASEGRGTALGTCLSTCQAITSKHVLPFLEMETAEVLKERLK